MLEPEIAPSISASRMNRWQRRDFPSPLGANCRQISCLQSFPKLSVEEEIDSSEPTVSFDHNELVAGTAFYEQRLMIKVSAVGDGHRDLLYRHILPQRLKDLRLRRIFG